MAPFTDRPRSPAEISHRALLRTLGLLKRVMHPRFVGLGVSGPQWAVLRVLSESKRRKEGGIRLADLGDRLLITPPSVTGVVERLRRDGLVEVVPGVEDRRSKLVRLTSAGSTLAGRVDRQLPAWIDDAMSGLDAHEHAEFTRLLTRLADRLEQIAPARLRRRGTRHPPAAVRD